MVLQKTYFEEEITRLQREIYKIKKINRTINISNMDEMDNIDINSGDEKIHVENSDITIREYIDNLYSKFSDENKELRKKLNDANIYI